MVGYPGSQMLVIFSILALCKPLLQFFCIKYPPPVQDVSDHPLKLTEWIHMNGP